MSVLQPLWLREEDVPELPEGWQAMTTEEAAVQLKPGKLYDQKTTSSVGEVAVVNQSLDSFVGFHNDEPGVFASSSLPVVTFANHTCAMRLMKTPFSCIQNVFPKIGRDDICDTRYFYYAAMGRVVLSDYKGHHPLFRQAYIPVPPLPTQQRIAAFLSAYDDLIENNTRRIAILEEMARRLYEEWFVHFRFPGYEKVEFVNAETGMTPIDWPVVPLDEIVLVNPRTTVPREGLKPFVPMGSLSETNMAIGPIEKREGNSGTKFQNGDTLVARITPCLENGKTGFVNFLNEEQPVAFGSTEFIVLRPLILGQHAIYCLARSHAFRDVAIKSMSGSEGRQRVRPESVKSFPLAKPPAALLERFEQIAQPMFNQVTALARTNANLRAQRDLLVPKLISGEIEVSEAEEAMEAAE
jgi:hypothetical protein